MPHALYVCLQDDDKIAAFAMDAESGQLTLRDEVAVAGGPSVLAISPDRRVLYVGHRTQPAISSFRIDQTTGALALLGTMSRRRMRRPFSPPTAPAGTSYRPIIRAGMRRSIRSARTARSARLRSTTWRRPPAPTR